MSDRLGFLGLGAIGSVIAGALVEAGHSVTVFDPRAEAVQELAGQARAPPRPSPTSPSAPRRSLPACRRPTWSARSRSATGACSPAAPCAP